MTDFQGELQNLAILYKIMASIFFIKDADRLFAFSLEEAAQLSASEIAVLWIYDRKSESLVIKKQIGIKEDTESGYNVKEPASLLWKSYSENIVKNILVNSDSDKSSVPFSKDYEIGSCLIIPFKIEQENNGAFFFARASKMPYDITDERMLTILVRECCACYENLLVRDNLRKIDQAKTEFISLAAHQLRAPITAIRLNIEGLSSKDVGKLNNDQLGYINQINESGLHMLDLVNALLDVSRFDLGVFKIDLRPVNVSDFAESVLDEFKLSIVEKKLIVKKLYDKTLPIFQADEKSLRIILQNLLSNAIKYTPAKGKINFEIGRVSKGGSFGGEKIEQDSLTILVKDFGAGIPLGQHDKIFSRLFRADNAVKSDIEGTGLGLYLVKKVVDETGGSIWFESVENKGSTFYVIFPISGMKNIKSIN
jgi:signal transduction histidine kinase